MLNSNISTVNAPVCFKGFLKYRTNILKCSTKKFKSIARDLKGMSLLRAIDGLAASSRTVCFFIHKDFMCIKKNLLNIVGLNIDIIKNIQIGFIVIEKRRKRLGTRFKARGKGNRSCTYDSSISVYLKHNDITDFNEFLLSNVSNIESAESK